MCMISQEIGPLGSSTSFMNRQGLDCKIVIVGAGCFGISTAYYLLTRGFQDITIIERSNEFPAKDASSNDINRSR